MRLIDRETGAFIEGDIQETTAEELGLLNQDERFEFNWILEVKNEVYKIFIIDNEKVVGLMSLIDVPKEFRLEINLLEVSTENIGKEKEVGNIVGCLIAFACRIAFRRKYGGFVSLIPKTKLREHYQQKYGFKYFGRQLAVHSSTAELLIEKYLENDG